jgi:hypothetical protein
MPVMCLQHDAMCSCPTVVNDSDMCAACRHFEDGGGMVAAVVVCEVQVWGHGMD